MSSSALLKLGHWGMLLSFLLSCVAVSLGYFFYQGLGMLAQVVAHLMLIVLPGVFKVSYLVRLTALKQLGLPVN